MSTPSTRPLQRPFQAGQDLPDVALLCSELIRYDSSVRGGLERDVAERVAAELSDMSLTIVERERIQLKAARAG